MLMMMITFLYSLRLIIFQSCYTRLLFEKKLNDVVGSELNGCIQP